MSPISDGKYASEASIIREALPKKLIPKKITNTLSEGIEDTEGLRTKKPKYYHGMREAQMPLQAPPGFKDIGAGGIGVDFPQGDIGQPFWFSNIGGNHFPREGFTYRPYDVPLVPLRDQMKGYVDDEDAQMGVNFLAAKTTGGQHYFKGKTESITKYIETFTNQINLDYIAWQIAKELLAFGNSFWRLRRPIQQVETVHDFQQIPIESLARIWWTPDRRPLWYEFRGAEYNGYFRPQEILHFCWNPLNGQVLGFGIMSQLTNRVSYLEDTPDGSIIKERESYLDIKHGLQNVSYKISKRYLPRNIFGAANASEETRDAMRSELRVLHDSEDIVHGIKGLDLKELGQMTRPIDPQIFMDLFQASIFKAVQTSKGRIAGQSQGPTYANGEESAILDEVGLSQLPIQLKLQIQNMIVKPWYDYHPTYDTTLTGGIPITIPWEACDYELMFGKQTKKDLEPEQVAQWVQILINSNQISPQELRNIAEKVGVPGLISSEEGLMPIDQVGDASAMQQNTEDSQARIAPGSPSKSRFSKA